MTFRPTPAHRRNIQGVILPLTVAIHRVFESRAQDGAMPLGAFYTENVSSDVWLHLGGIWYRPVDAEAFASRRPNEEVVVAFSASLQSGQTTVLPSGAVIEWESIPHEQAQLLPPPLRSESDA